MAKKKTLPSGGNKSSAIRQILAAQPKASTAEIKSKLDAQGVAASVALINKLKYGRTGSTAGKKGAGSKKGASKAASIREKFEQLGYDARPRDVIAALKSEGVKVTSAQVSMLRAKQGSNGKTRSQSVGAVSYDHLLAAKRLAEQLGGVEKARRALESYAQLVNG